MNNLMDGIRRFKLARQKSQPAKAQDELDDLVEMYKAIGPTDGVLKLNFNRQWDKLSEEKRSKLVNRLLKQGLLPQEVRDALEIFNGKVISLV